eukprot:1173380-Alexandrium_andersonii.AAC.1
MHIVEPLIGEPGIMKKPSSAAIDSGKPALLKKPSTDSGKPAVLKKPSSNSGKPAVLKRPSSEMASDPEGDADDDGLDKLRDVLKARKFKVIRMSKLSNVVRLSVHWLSVSVFCFDLNVAAP